MDFFLGVIIGVVGTVIYLDIKEKREQAKRPRRGRPPKKIEVKDKDD